MVSLHPHIKTFFSQKPVVFDKQSLLACQSEVRGEGSGGIALKAIRRMASIQVISLFDDTFLQRALALSPNFKNSL